MSNSIVRTGSICTDNSQTFNNGSRRRSMAASLARKLFKGVAFGAVASVVKGMDSNTCNSMKLVRGNAFEFESFSSLEGRAGVHITIDSPKTGDQLTCDRETKVILGDYQGLPFYGKGHSYLELKQLNEGVMVKWGASNENSKKISGTLSDFRFNFFSDGAVLKVPCQKQPVFAEWNTHESYGDPWGRSKPPWERPMKCKLQAVGNRDAKVCVYRQPHDPSVFMGERNSVDIRSLPSPTKSTPNPTPKPTPIQTTEQITAPPTKPTPEPTIRIATLRFTSTATSSLTSTATSSPITANDEWVDPKNLVPKEIEVFKNMRNISGDIIEADESKSTLSTLAIALSSLGGILTLMFICCVLNFHQNRASQVHPEEDDGMPYRLKGNEEGAKGNGKEVVLFAESVVAESVV